MELEGLALENLKYRLFAKRRFLPIFLAAFLGAINDNLLRCGLVVLIAYSAQHGITLPTRPEILVTICSALLVIPMILFASISGALADKYEKSRMVRLAKLAEVFIMAAAYYGFATQNIFLLMFLLFISGMHTSFYSPIKFSILPDHLNKSELLAGNGFMAGGTYLAILLGMITGGLLVELPNNVIGKAALGVALAGLLASLFVLPSQAAHPAMRINWNIFKGTCDIIAHATHDRTVKLSILALSWFLLIGGVYMSQFANYAQAVIHADNEVYILFLTLFSVGIAIGSLLCDTLLKGEISPKLTPWAGLGMSVFTYLLVLTTPAPTHEGLLTVGDFFGAAKNWPIMACMMLVALSGGIYMVPLYALLQERTNAMFRSRILAASNLSDSVFMTTAALLSALLLSLGCGIMDLFLIVATLNLGVVWYARKETR
jgi:MFS family permease